ncbi:MAG: TonB-dependent receptor [Verrucomicrobiota bacterium]
MRLKIVQQTIPSHLILGFALTAVPPSAQSEEEKVYTLPTLYVTEQQTANTAPVTTYAMPVSNLEFEPRVDLQTRNMGEAQGDVSIRGGIFENTGFRIGAATLLDPQTGHYFAEIPISPEMLVGPDILVGTDNALYGFNSTVGTVSYGWSEITNEGSATIGGGDHDLNFQRFQQGITESIDGSEWSWGIQVEASRSESDGSVAFGDHDFSRASGRIQLLGPNSQTDLFAGYQDKFFGLFGLYTGSAFTAFNPFETENLKTRLFVFNHQQTYDADSSWELTAYSRRHSDHYIFNRFSPNNAFIHETEAHAIALSGTHALSQTLFLNFAGQVTADEIESTNLENSFTSRTYFKLSVVPEYRIQLSDTRTLSTQLGASFDDTNRNDSEFSPIFKIELNEQGKELDNKSIYFSFTETTQVAGYTAIGGGTAGLFASDPDLNRETSQNLELGAQITRKDWSLETAVFYRWDDDLVDWTFENGSPNARSANNVDTETFGFEVIGTGRIGDLEAIASYTYLHKDEDYGDANIVGSFYALNYPEHRVTLGAIWSPYQSIQIRIDNEWRSQEANLLRNSEDEALFTHASISFFPPQFENLEIFGAVDNAWDDGFEEVPGTPGRGDLYSGGITLRW